MARSFSLFLQIASLGEQPFLQEEARRIVSHHLIEELKNCPKKEPFFSNKAKNQSHSFSHPQITASLNRQNL